MRQIWAPWRMEYLSADEPPSADAGCILCAIQANDHAQAEHVVERTERTYTVLNRFPYSNGHLMVVPLRHAAHLTDLDPDEASALMHGAQRAVRAVESAYAPGGFNLGINHGHAAGAGIDEHCHLHVVPRWIGDTNFMPVLADVRVLPEHLNRTADRLRGAYATL